MAQLSESDAQAILKKVLALSKADEAEATLDGSRKGNLRYARAAVSTSGGADEVSLVVQSTYGKKTGIATINEFDDASLEKVVRRSEELAKLAPENPEYMPFLGPQKYPDPQSYSEATAGITPDWRAKQSGASIDLCKEHKLFGAGFLENDASYAAVANTRGLTGYQRSTGVDFSVTVRTADGKGSGYGVSDYNDASKMDTAADTQVALDKALRSSDTRAIEPGKYTVILEPAASVDLISHMVSQMDAPHRRRRPKLPHQGRAAAPAWAKSWWTSASTSTPTR